MARVILIYTYGNFIVFRIILILFSFLKFQTTNKNKIKYIKQMIQSFVPTRKKRFIVLVTRIKVELADIHQKILVFLILPEIFL
jgi:hypothetical protein